MAQPLRFGLAGVGYFGKHYLRILGDTPDAALTAVLGRSAETFEHSPAPIPASARKFVDPDGFFNASDVDCVVIATPASTHFDFARRALEAGKHVLVEKPMALSRADAEALRPFVERAGRTFMVGHQYLYNDYILRLKAEIERGAIGEPRYMFTEHFYSGIMRGDASCLWDAGTHDFALFDFLFDPGTITEVSGARTAINARGRDDFSALTARGERGPVFSLALSWFAPEKVRRTVVAGDRGFAVFDDGAEREKLRFCDAPYPELGGADPLETKFFNTAASPRIPDVAAREPLRNEIEHFVECIRSGVSPRTDIEHGIRVTKMLEVVESRI